MPFPSPSLPAPGLSNYQMSFRGTAFGGLAGSYQLVKIIKGMEPPPSVTGDTQRALDQGEFVGLDVLPGKDIELEEIVIPDEVSLDHARQVLAGVMGYGGSTEEPLYLQLPSGIFACMARPRKHAPVNAAVDTLTTLADAAQMATLLHATDPRWYAVPTKTATVGLPPPLGGLKFNVTFEASFGGGGIGGLLEVKNRGNFEMRPVLIIKGPCTNPVITNLTIPGAPWIGFTITLAEGDVLEVETDYGSVLYTPSGSPFGSSREKTLMEGSTWWNLPPGLNVVEFTTSDGVQVAGTLTVQSADAYIGL